MRYSVFGILALIAAWPVLAQQAGLPVPPPATSPTPDEAFERGGLMMRLISPDQCIREIGGVNCFTWLNRPTLVEARQVYPAAALAAGQGGVATLRCTVTDQGDLSACAVSSESPAAQGFGDAALKLAAQFQMDRTGRDFPQIVGRQIVTPVWFDLGPGSEAPLAVSTRIITASDVPILALRNARILEFEHQLEATDCRAPARPPARNPIGMIPLQPLTCGGVDAG